VIRDVHRRGFGAAGFRLGMNLTALRDRLPAARHESWPADPDRAQLLRGGHLPPAVVWEDADATLTRGGGQ
jgi:hypothetical protein